MDLYIFFAFLKVVPLFFLTTNRLFNSPNYKDKVTQLSASCMLGNAPLKMLITVKIGRQTFWDINAFYISNWNKKLSLFLKANKMQKNASYPTLTLASDNLLTCSLACGYSLSGVCSSFWWQTVVVVAKLGYLIYMCRFPLASLADQRIKLSELATSTQHRHQQLLLLLSTLYCSS